MTREANIQKAKEVREGWLELARDYIDATHIEVGQITAKDDARALVTIRVSDANRYAPYHGRDTSEFIVGDYWMVNFDDLGIVRLLSWTSNATGGGSKPLAPREDTHIHAYKEDKSGECDGAKVIFITAQQFEPYTLQVLLNGQEQVDGAANDYLEGAMFDSFTMAAAPVGGDTLIMHYLVER